MRLITVIAPEIIVGKGMVDLLAARKLRRELKHLAETDGVEWELCHSFFLLMGGVLVVPRPKGTAVEEPVPEAQLLPA